MATRHSAVYTTTFLDLLSRIKGKQIVLSNYRYARPTIVQIEVEVVGDDVDRNYRVNIAEVHNSGWHKKQKSLQPEEYCAWVWKRVIAYHDKHPEFNPSVYIDCVPPTQMELL